jgi:hypothetical protein
MITLKQIGTSYLIEPVSVGMVKTAREGLERRGLTVNRSTVPCENNVYSVLDRERDVATIRGAIVYSPDARIDDFVEEGLLIRTHGFYSVDSPGDFSKALRDEGFETSPLDVGVGYVVMSQDGCRTIGYVRKGEFYPNRDYEGIIESLRGNSEIIFSED